MVAEKYRLLRLNHTDVPLSYDYFHSFTPGLEARFTSDSRDAYLFPTWEAFVQAATTLWLSSGPSDIMYELVYVMGQEDAGSV